MISLESIRVETCPQVFKTDGQKKQRSDIYSRVCSEAHA